MAESEFRWTQDSFGLEDERLARRISGRSKKLAWLGVIALALIVLELTADPALATALGCAKFGWNEVTLARWLKKNDPDRRRGRICSRFYLAWGLWRVSLVATALMFLLAIAYVKLEQTLGIAPRVAGPPPAFTSALLLALAGFLLSSAMSSIAVLSALRHRVKVWVGPEAHWAREEQTWPPHAVRRRRNTSNRTKAILLSALITALMLGLLAIVLPLSHAFPVEFKSPTLFLVLLFTFMIGAPIAILALLEMLRARMIAATPEECWADTDAVRPLKS